MRPVPIPKVKKPTGAVPTQKKFFRPREPIDLQLVEASALRKNFFSVSVGPRGTPFAGR